LSRIYECTALSKFDVNGFVIASDPSYARWASFGGYESTEARSAYVEAKQSGFHRKASWIASSLTLLAMTKLFTA